MRNHKALTPSQPNDFLLIIIEITIGLGWSTSCISDLEIKPLTMPWTIQVWGLVAFFL